MTFITAFYTEHLILADKLLLRNTLIGLNTVGGNHRRSAGKIFLR
jgi:hypothetical protein